MYGLAPFGAQAYASGRAASDSTITVYLNGETVTDLLASGSLHITDQLSSRSTCEMKLIDETKTRTYQTGESVVVRWHGATLFAGTVDNFEREFSLTSSFAMLSLRCVDFNQLTDRFYVNQIFEGMTLKAIVMKILTDPQTTLGASIAPLTAEGVTAGEIADGPVIDRMHVSFKTIKSVFDELAKATGLQWNIDYNKRLHFIDRAQFVAPFNVTDAQAVYRGMNLRLDRGKYRNRQIFQAGNERTEQQIDKFRGDAASSSQQPEKRNRTFTLAYPLASTPTVKRNGVTQRLGIKGTDPDGDLTKPTSSTWAQWFYQVKETEITQNSVEDEVNNPTLNTTDVLEVTYIGLFPFVADVTLDSELVARQAVEGGSGEYQNVESDETIDGSDFAIQRANRLLTVNGQIVKEIPYEFEAPNSTIAALGLGPGVAAGQVQTINVAELGINAQYLIDSVSYDLLEDFRTLRIKVRALAGEHDEDPAEFFRQLVEAGRPITIRENEKIIVGKQFKDSVRLIDSLTDSVNNPPVTLNPYTDDPFSYAMFGDPITLASGEKVYFWAIGRSRIGLPFGA